MGVGVCCDGVWGAVPSGYHAAAMLCNSPTQLLLVCST